MGLPFLSSRTTSFQVIRQIEIAANLNYEVPSCHQQRAHVLELPALFTPLKI